MPCDHASNVLNTRRAFLESSLRPYSAFIVFALILFCDASNVAKTPAAKVVKPSKAHKPQVSTPLQAESSNTNKHSPTSLGTAAKVLSARSNIEVVSKAPAAKSVSPRLSPSGVAKNRIGSQASKVPPSSKARGIKASLGDSGSSGLVQGADLLSKPVVLSISNLISEPRSPSEAMPARKSVPVGTAPKTLAAKVVHRGNGTSPSASLKSSASVAIKSSPSAGEGVAGASASRKIPASKVGSRVGNSSVQKLQTLKAPQEAPKPNKASMSRVFEAKQDSENKSHNLKLSSEKLSALGLPTAAAMKSLYEISSRGSISKGSSLTSDEGIIGTSAASDVQSLHEATKNHTLNLHFAQVALHSSGLESILACTSLPTCSRIQEAKRGWQYTLNNLLLWLHTEFGGQPSGSVWPATFDMSLRRLIELAQEFDESVGNVSNRNLLSTLKGKSLDIFSAAFQSLLGSTTLRKRLQSAQANVISFTGTSPNRQVSIRIAQVVKLSSGQEMPVVGFSTRCLPAANLRQSILWALRAGYHHLDVSPGTLSELATAQAVASHIEDTGSNRSALFVTLRTRMIHWDDPSRIREILDTQLKTLHTTYVDLYLLHGPAPSTKALLRQWSAFEAAFESGKARSIGLSSVSIKHFKELLASARIKPHIVQSPHNIYSSFETADNGGQIMLGVALQRNKTYSLVQGLLSGGQELLEPLHDPHVLHIAKEHGKSTALILQRWAIQSGMLALSCSTSENHIKNNLDVFSFELSELDMAVLSNLAILSQSVPGAQLRPTWKSDIFGLETVYQKF